MTATGGPGQRPSQNGLARAAIGSIVGVVDTDVPLLALLSASGCLTSSRT